MGNQSLERGLSILNLLDSRGGELGIRDIARALELSPTIVQRLVNSLAATGFVEQLRATRRYRLGYRAIVLGSAMRREDRLLSAATRELMRLADEHHLNGYLGVLRDGEGIYLESIQSSGPISVRVLPGSRISLHSTAIGKMLLSTLPDEEVSAILGKEPLRAVTRATRTRIADLLSDLGDIRRQGYAAVHNENIEGLASAAALIHDAGDRPVAAISVAFLSSERSPEVASVVSLVLEAAHHCAQAIGHSGPCPSPRLDAATEEIG